MFNMYAMRDCKAQISMTPFVAENDIVVARMLREAMRNADSMMAKYPEDFEIQHLGTWSPESGLLTSLDGMRIVGRVSDLVPPPAEQAPVLAVATPPVAA